jgi:energy-coupling factor transporter ATP-binding protein EcfA2
MITEIQIEGFKNLEKVKLTLGRLNLFVGTNASGKSNFLDALRLLQGIGYGFTVNEILNGKPKSAKSEVWEGIRGGSGYATFRKINQSSNYPIFFAVKLIVDTHTFLYEIRLDVDAGTVFYESLSHNNQPLYTTTERVEGRPYVRARIPRRTTKGHPPVYEFDHSRPLLHQVAMHKECPNPSRNSIELCIKALSNAQRIDPQPLLLRSYSSAHEVSRMGERGENFAALVKTILKDEKSKSAYLSWLQQLTPADIDDVLVLPGALQEPLFAVKEKGVECPAPILSDGSLRFAAITASFFQPDPPDILTIEEIENGIHASRVRLLVELLKSRTMDGLQVMATTHSPIVLAWLKESDYRTVFLCKRDEVTGAAEIRPLTEVPNFLEIVSKQPIADLFAEGWLEGAL